MKCPDCGRELRDDEKFCPGCGRRIEQRVNEYAVSPDAPAADGGIRREPVKKSRVGAAVKAVIAVILYLLLLIGIQSCVIGGYLGATMDAGSLIPAMQSGDEEAFRDAYQAALEKGLTLAAENQATLLLIANLLAVLVVCLMFRMRGKKPVEEFALYPVAPRRILQFALIGVFLNITLSFLLSALPLPEDLVALQEEQYAPLFEGSLLVSLLSVGIVGPVTEEIYFRGISMTRLGPVLGGGAAAVLSAFLFGLAHGTPLAIGYAFLIGVLLAVVYNRYGPILPGIVCHCGVNLTSYWLGFIENDILFTALFVFSLIGLIGLFILAVINYPSFGDVLFDPAGRIRVSDPKKQAIIDEVRRIRTSGTGVDPGEIAALAERWDGLDESGKDGGGEGR